MISSIIIIYASVSAFVYFAQRSLIYFPTKSALNINEETIAFNNGDITLRGWVVNKGREKAVIYYGGNAEQIEYSIPELKDTLRDYSIYFINYRGYGKSDGSPSEAGIFSDALTIYDAISANHKSISLIGRSLGSGVASYVASHRQPEKVVLVTPYDSILNIAKKQFWFLPVPLLLKDRYESWKYAKEINSNVLILAAEYDEVIAPEHTINLAKHLNGNARMQVLKGESHNSISNNHQYNREIGEFL